MNPKIKLDLQIATRSKKIPTRKQFQNWVAVALKSQRKNYEVIIRVVGEKESAELNQHFRHKPGPTNILSFPFDEPSSNLLGDIIICAPLVETEAKSQGKAPLAHWAHLVIHGVLHLLGYDHIKEQDAKIMEGLEIKTLQQLGFPNPYEP